MKQTSIQQSSNEATVVANSLRDEMYSLFVLEYDNRGTRYFDWLSGITVVSEGKVPADTPLIFIRRLAVNPSLVSIFSQDNPLKAIEQIVSGDFNDHQIRFINDFLDDISINVRMKAESLYMQRLAALKDQVYTSISRCNGMEDRMENVKNALDRCEHNLLAFYYLRKIGYAAELNRNPG